MERLQAVIDEVRAVRDCESSRRLCLDAWMWGLVHGEGEGLKLAAVILKGVIEYQRAEAKRCAFLPGRATRADD